MMQLQIKSEAERITKRRISFHSTQGFFYFKYQYLVATRRQCFRKDKMAVTNVTLSKRHRDKASSDAIVRCAESAVSASTRHIGFLFFKTASIDKRFEWVRIQFVFIALATGIFGSCLEIFFGLMACLLLLI